MKVSRRLLIRTDNQKLLPDIRLNGKRQLYESTLNARSPTNHLSLFPSLDVVWENKSLFQRNKNHHISFLPLVNLRTYILFSCLFSLNCILSLKLVFVCMFLCCYICYLKKYMTPLKITVLKTLRMAAQFY